MCRSKPLLLSLSEMTLHSLSLALSSRRTLTAFDAAAVTLFHEKEEEKVIGLVTLAPVLSTGLSQKIRIL